MSVDGSWDSSGSRSRTGSCTDERTVAKSLSGHTQLPNGITLDGAGLVYQIVPGTQLGVYQQLSTKSGGEVVSADSY
jgi:hypothetical protein